MTARKPQSIKVGYSTFVDDELDAEYESCSDGGDNAFSDSIRPSAPMATTSTIVAPSASVVTSARVISPGSNSNSNRINNSIASSAPPGSPVVLGARVVRQGRPNAQQINQSTLPVAMPTHSSAPVTVVGARVVAPSPQRQVLQVPVVVVGQPAVVAAPSLPAAYYYPGTGAPPVVGSAPKVIAARVISPSRS